MLKTLIARSEDLETGRLKPTVRPVATTVQPNRVGDAAGESPRWKIRGDCTSTCEKTKRISANVVCRLAACFHIVDSLLSVLVNQYTV